MTATAETMPAFDRTLAALEAGRAEGLHPGAQIYVSRRGTALLDTAIGEARAGVPMQPDTLMLWLSAGKPVTALALARLREHGGLDWDNLVTRFLPEFAAGRKERVTLRHLLTHTAGFRGADQLDPAWSWDELITRICRQPLEPGWVPGQRGGYQLSSSWYVLGEIVQRLDGRPFPQFVREEIFLPLGLPDSWIGMPTEPYRAYGERIGVMHQTQRRSPEPQPGWDTAEGSARCRPGSNARGPVRELGRIYEALSRALGSAASRPTLDPEREAPASPADRLPPAAVRDLVHRHRAGLFDQTFRHIVDFGLGFLLNSNRYFEAGEQPSYGYSRHASADTFGHSGNQCSCAFADPARGLVIAWVCNGMPGEPRHQKRARAINTAIYEDLAMGGVEASKTLSRGA